MPPPPLRPQVSTGNKQEINGLGGLQRKLFSGDNVTSKRKRMCREENETAGGQPVTGSEGQEGGEEQTGRGSGDKHPCDSDLGKVDFY